MQIATLKKALKDPVGIALYLFFEKLKTKDGRRVFSTNLYKKLAKGVNVRRNAKYKPARDAFMQDFKANCSEHCPEHFMKNGWERFEKSYFPGTAGLVELGNKLFKEKGRDASRKVMPYSIAGYEELLQYREVRDFVFSDKLLLHAIDYLQEFPVLTNLNLLRSDPVDNKEWIESQQFHLDVIDAKVLRVVVYINDVTAENGPFTFYPLDVSEKISKDKKIKYGSPLTSMNIQDKYLHGYPSDQQIEVTGTSGTVLTVDTCRCFHFGSRIKSSSRCVLMLTFTTPSLENMRGAMGLDKLPQVREKAMEKEVVSMNRKWNRGN